MRLTQIAMTAVLLTLTNVGFAALADDVGDADSFGRQVKYLGSKSSGFVFLEPDCSAMAGSLDRCVTLAATGSTSIGLPSLLTIKLPAFSTRSLVCYSFNLYESHEFANYGTTKQDSYFNVRATFTVENAVLNNPSIIDPFTGLPANGKLLGSFSSDSDSRSLAPGDYERGGHNYSRECGGGLVSRSFLQAAGLTSSQIALFFANPITITFSSVGTASGMTYGSYRFGLRLYGD